jgi:hypothetical protein
MTKMDWDRVHSEDLTRRQLAKYGRPKKRKLKLSASKGKLKRKPKRPALAAATPPKRVISTRAPMPGWTLPILPAVPRRTPPSRRSIPGCTCGKPVGFKGLHKARCPIRIQGDATAAASAKAPQQRRAKRLAVYYGNLAKAEKREAEDRRSGITEKVHPLRSVFGSLPKKAAKDSKDSKILQGGLPGLGKRR